MMALYVETSWSPFQLWLPDIFYQSNCIYCVVSIVCCIYHVCRNSVLSFTTSNLKYWMEESCFLFTTRGSDYCKHGHVSHHAKLKATQEKGLLWLATQDGKKNVCWWVPTCGRQLCWCPCGLAALDVARLLLGGQEDLRHHYRARNWTFDEITFWSLLKVPFKTDLLVKTVWKNSVAKLV